MFSATRGVSSLTELRARYLNAQLRGDRQEALRVVLEEGLAGGASLGELQREILQAAQCEIGQLWEQNEITIAQEYTATAITQMALARLYDEAARLPSNGKKIMIACVQGELHDLPARLVADALDLAGFEVCYLGADVAIDKLVTRMREQPPDLLALSATLYFNLPALRQTVRTVREHTAQHLPIIVGGAACVHEIVSELGVDGTASNVEDIVTCVQRLLGLA
jgi:MerR family transcriptional regulator, light-induced transcriptional regulator